MSIAISKNTQGSPRKFLFSVHNFNNVIVKLCNYPTFNYRFLFLFIYVLRKFYAWETLIYHYKTKYYIYTLGSTLTKYYVQCFTMNNVYVTNQNEAYVCIHDITWKKTKKKLSSQYIKKSQQFTTRNYKMKSAQFVSKCVFVITFFQITS